MGTFYWPSSYIPKINPDLLCYKLLLIIRSQSKTYNSKENIVFGRREETIVEEAK